MSHSSRHIKAKDVALRTKDQRDEKQRKDELDFSLSVDKVTSGHIDVLFLWDKCEK